ncbi:unnamed protein product, partial [Amoebophrya sp. A25]
RDSRGTIALGDTLAAIPEAAEDAEVVEIGTSDSLPNTANKKKGTSLSTKTLYKDFDEEKNAKNKEGKVSGCKVKVVTASRDILSVPFADVCSKVGEAINFEYNCYRVNRSGAAKDADQAASSDPKDGEDAETSGGGVDASASSGTLLEDDFQPEMQDSKQLRKLRNAAAAEKANQELFASVEEAGANDN